MPCFVIICLSITFLSSPCRFPNAHRQHLVVAKHKKHVDAGATKHWGTAEREIPQLRRLYRKQVIESWLSVKASTSWGFRAAQAKIAGGSQSETAECLKNIMAWIETMELGLLIYFLHQRLLLLVLNVLHLVNTKWCHCYPKSQISTLSYIYICICIYIE